jgi:sulfoxide reductase catalytic subunit YedY
MILLRKPDLTENDVTDESLFLDRRRFILSASALLGQAWVGRQALAGPACDAKLDSDTRSAGGERPNTWDEITAYNNYYEFSTDKQAVRILAQELTLNPWTVRIEGEVEKPLTLDVDDLARRFAMEERIYRLRCVEGWSMVVPWNGFPLCKLLALARPTSNAKYVEFVSLQRPKEMIGQRRPSLAWPYREGLRMDEAMHPLAFAVTGLYGKPLPAQNGAPLRLALPWKYGYKSPKAITHIRLLREQPETSWHRAAPTEYGFYGNVNPDVSHPRWSQRRENRIGELRKRPTLLFNGYAEQVAQLYKGMDLQVHS